jgi:hypothetical protein
MPRIVKLCARSPLDQRANDGHRNFLDGDSGGFPRGCTPQIAVVAEWSSAPLQRKRPWPSRPYVM